MQKLSRICAQKGQNPVWAVTSAEKGQTNTCGSASAHVLPPMIIFPREKTSLYLMKGAPADTLFTGTKFGWVNGSIFSSVVNQRSQYYSYMMDMHLTEIIDYAILHQIEIMCLPAHSSHLLQPLDVAVFKSLKSHFGAACRKFLHSNPGKVITIFYIVRFIGRVIMCNVWHTMPNIKYYLPLKYGLDPFVLL